MIGSSRAGSVPIDRSSALAPRSLPSQFRPKRDSNSSNDKKFTKPSVPQSDSDSSDHIKSTKPLPLRHNPRVNDRRRGSAIPGSSQCGASSLEQVPLDGILLLFLSGIILV